MALFNLTCPGCPASQDPGALWRLDVATGTVRQLAERGARAPRFSPDSRWLSVSSYLGAMISPNGSVGLIDLEGRGELALFELVSVWDRAWAIDSSGFVVAFAEAAPSPVVTELWWIPTGGPPERLGQLTDVAELSWQPGGGRLVYRKWVGEGTTRLYLTQGRDGSQELPIPGSEGMSAQAYGLLPSWSPDGRWLLVVKEDGTYYLLDTDGPSLHRLDAHVVFGWLDAGHYLVSIIQGEDLERYRRGDDTLRALDLYRCAPLGRCEWLAQVPRLARLSYAQRCQ